MGFVKESCQILSSDIFWDLFYRTSARGERTDVVDFSGTRCQHFSGLSCVFAGNTISLRSRRYFLVVCELCTNQPILRFALFKVI